MTLKKSLLLLPLTLLACSPGAQTCIVGQSAACTCTSGKTGAQVCQSDGTFGACSCTGTGPTDTNPGMADGGTNPSVGPKRVFVTKLTYSAKAVSDSICQNAADAVSLGGKWKAWLTYRFANENAIDRITATGPWKLLTGETVFQNHGQLSTTPSVAIQVTEMGTKLTQTEVVFTGTTTGGVASDQDCSGWGSDSAGLYATVGLCSATDTKWTSYDLQLCTTSAHLYCFEI